MSDILQDPIISSFDMKLKELPRTFQFECFLKKNLRHRIRSTIGKNGSSRIPLRLFLLENLQMCLNNQ